MSSLAEYLDSTSELRGRRDRMLAMCDEYEENRRHPWRWAADARGIVSICERAHAATGEWLPLDPPVEIHHDDVDWLVKLWEKGDLLDFEIWRAGAS